MRAARPGDWKALPMPAAWERIDLAASYTAEEFERLAAGEIPESMEDKWFILYEVPWLYLHRSWTGYCIYQVRFEPDAEGMRVAEVRVNRDPAQRREIGAGDAAMVQILLDQRAGRDVRRQMQEFIWQRQGKNHGTDTS